jgi:sarcosine oxidase subunit gamma
MVERTAPRLTALDSDAASPAPHPTAVLRPLEAMTKLVLRGRPAAVDAAGRAFGVALPRLACRAATAGQRAALWLGPDEWLLMAPAAEREALIERLDSALGQLAHALVDISDRDLALEISGPRAANVLNTGCPLDLDPSAFPVGMCTRTLIGKGQVVLWRTAADTFHVDAARSYSAYVWRLLDEACREFAS